ncbi:MAG: hypothetical protein WBW74_07675 [Xanthobacteraceae bacterium]
MRNIILAVMIAVGASAIVYLLATVLGFPTEVAKGAAGLPAFAIQKVYEFLETRSAKRSLAKAGLKPTMSVNEFSIHPLSAFLFSFIMWSGVFFFSGSLMGMCVAMAGAISKIDIEETQPKLFAYLIIFTALPLRIIAAAYIGCWIGTRSRRYVLAILIGAIALGSGATFLLSFLFLMNDDKFKVVAEGRAALAQFIQIVPDIAIYIISAALGFWYGQRQKPAYYLGFIMKILPQQTRQTIVEMAQDEALRARRPAPQDPVPAPVSAA